MIPGGIGDVSILRLATLSAHEATGVRDAQRANGAGVNEQGVVDGGRDQTGVERQGDVIGFWKQGERWRTKGARLRR